MPKRMPLTFCHLLKGLFFICNPFTQSGVEFWIQKSFENYCLSPNPTNIKENIDLQNCSDKIILEKLRWATLGYHHNWDTKVFLYRNRIIEIEVINFYIRRIFLLGV